MEYTIDELARVAGTNVRNVRAYQDRRIMPPPIRRGRLGVYTDIHLARLRLIGQLLERGYSINNIGELIDGLSKGQDLAQLLGLENAIAAPWSNEVEARMTAQQLAELFGPVDAEVMRQAIKVGLFKPDGDRFAVPSPRALEIGAELVKAGVPMLPLLQQFAMLRDDAERIAQRFINLFVGEFVDKHGDVALPPAAELPKLSDLIRRLRPQVRALVDAELAHALERTIQETLGTRMARALRERADAAKKRRKAKNPVARAMRRVSKTRR